MASSAGCTLAFLFQCSLGASSFNSLLAGTYHAGLKTFLSYCSTAICVDYREALKSSNCTAIHVTEIEQDVECDTFFPALDPKHWQRWSSTVPQWDNGFRHSFLCYTPASLRSPPDLPPALPSRHEEYQVSCNCLPFPPCLQDNFLYLWQCPSRSDITIGGLGKESQ